MGDSDDEDVQLSADFVSAVISDCSSDLEGLVREMIEALKCEEGAELSVAKFKTLRKDDLVGLLFNTYQILRSHEAPLRKLKCAVDNMKDEHIELQRKVIKLQGELLDVKSEQLESVKSTVKTAVQETVTEEIKCYSKVVSESVSNGLPAITAKNLRKAVQRVVTEEDRTKNVVIFGLEENENEELSDKINYVFEHIDEKPRFDAVRIGMKSAGKVRPVKVKLPNSTAVHQILVKCKELRRCEDLKTVFISPDRSPEQRAERQKLVSEMKQMIEADKESDKHYFIRKGKICCE